VGYRSVHLSIVDDEVATLASVHQKGYVRLLLAKDQNARAHFLNAVLVKACVGLLPFNEIVISRLPSLLGLALFLWGVWRIGLMFPTGVTRVLITVALLSNAFLLDFFSISRGYGLATGFTVLSLSYLLEASVVKSAGDRSPQQQTAISLWLAVGAALSNGAFLHFYVVLLGAALWLNWRNCLKASCLGSVLVVSAFYVPRVLLARGQDELWGGDVGFVHDTVSSLVRCSFYDSPISTQLTGRLATAIALLVLLLACWSRCERIRSGFILSMMCLLAAAASFMAHLLVNMSYPEERAVLYLVPLVILAIGTVAAWSRFCWLRFSLWGLLLAFSTIGLEQANLNHSLTYRDDADIPSVLLKLQGAHQKTGQHVMLAHSDGYKWVVWYYAEHLLALSPKSSNTGESYIRTYGWLTVYEWRGVYPYARLSPYSLMPGTTFLLLDRDDEHLFTGQLRGRLALLQYFPHSDLRLYALTAPEYQGTLTSPDGRTYVGEFEDGEPSGNGTYTWPNGDRYEGEWRDGKMNGQGMRTWTSGKKYAGQFSDGKMDGKGKMTYPAGKVEEGIWKDDRFVGASTSP
jgi:hypothetical protein